MTEGETMTTLPRGTVTGTLDAPVGTTVTFTPDPRQVIFPGLIDISEPIQVLLDEAGTFSVDLVATDAPDSDPTDWTYRVDVIAPGAEDWTFHIEVPAGTTRDLSDIASVLHEGVYIMKGPEGPEGPAGPKGDPLDTTGVEQGMTIIADGLGGSSWTWPTGDGGGVTDHGLLTGLEDDDHPQYLTAQRGDARYDATGTAAGLVGALDIPQAPEDVNAAPAVHTHALGDVTGLQAALDGKAPTAHSHVPTDISGSTTVGREVLTASSMTAAREAIGAGTSSLNLGVGPTTAAPGDHLHDDRYFTQSEVNAALTGKADATHDHDGTYQPVGDYASATHDHDERYVRTVNGTGPDASGDVAVAGGGGSTTQPHLWAYRYANQSLANGLDYVADFRHSGADEGGWGNYGAGQWTVPAAGLYQVVWYYKILGGPPTSVYATPLVDGSPALPEMVTYGGSTWLGSAFVRVGAGQRVAMRIKVSGSNLNLQGDSNKMSSGASFMQWTKVSD